MHADLAALWRDTPLCSHQRIDAGRKANSAGSLRRGASPCRVDPRNGGGDAELPEQLTEFDPADDFSAGRIDEDNDPASARSGATAAASADG